jgi:hypothetical protein
LYQQRGNAKINRDAMLPISRSQIASNAAVLMTVFPLLYPAPGRAAKMQDSPAQEMQEIRFVVRRRKVRRPSLLLWARTSFVVAALGSFFLCPPN